MFWQGVGLARRWGVVGVEKVLGVQWGGEVGVAGLVWKRGGWWGWREGCESCEFKGAFDGHGGQTFAVLATP